MLLALLVNASFWVSKPGDEVLKYQPTKNFDGLKELYVFSKTFTTAGWTTNPQLTFDSAGVVR